MSFFTNPTSYRIANPGAAISSEPLYLDNAFSTFKRAVAPPHSSHPAFGHLILLVFEAVLEVVCVSAPGYIVARQGMFNAENQKFVANLNVILFTPCLIFTKLASQLTADKLVELAVIPFIFVVQTIVSYLCSIGTAKLFRLKKRPSHFVVAMGVFGNSNSLPISLVLSLSKTISGLHWDKIPGDNDEEVGARGILYLLIFQQLGQLVRWSWGYHVLLAPPHKFKDEDQLTNIHVEQGQGRYRDNPEEEDEEEDLISGISPNEDDGTQSGDGTENGGGNMRIKADLEADRLPQATRLQLSSSNSSTSYVSGEHDEPESAPELLGTPANGNMLPSNGSNGHITSFPSIISAPAPADEPLPNSPKGWLVWLQRSLKRSLARGIHGISALSTKLYSHFPKPVQKVLSKIEAGIERFLHGLWEFMNPPLWAMLVAIIIASVPSLQRLFFSEGTFIKNSVTRAISQSGAVAVPLILVVLGANLARNTLPEDPHRTIEHDKEETKILIASLLSRMLLPTIVMAPLLAVTAKFVPVSILDDPIFVIVCFLLTGAPSALQLAQICQINGVYEGVMSRLLFQSYVIWILPSTLILVMLALEVVEWAAA